MKQKGKKQLILHDKTSEKNCNKIKIIADLLLKEKREFTWLDDSDRIHGGIFQSVRPIVQWKIASFLYKILALFDKYYSQRIRLRLTSILRVKSCSLRKD